MSEEDDVTQVEEADDLFPVRDIQTDRSRIPLKSSKFSAKNSSRRSMDFYLNFQGLTISEVVDKLCQLSQLWYNKACSEVKHAIIDVKNTCISNVGNRYEKSKVTSRLVMYYLIVLALFVIKSCFWVNRILLEGLYKTLLNCNKNTQMLIGLGVMFSLIVMAYVIGTPNCCAESVTNTKPWSV